MLIRIETEILRDLEDLAVLEFARQTFVVPARDGLIPPHRPLPHRQALHRLEIHHGPESFDVVHISISLQLLIRIDPYRPYDWLTVLGAALSAIGFKTVKVAVGRRHGRGRGSTGNRWQRTVVLSGLGILSLGVIGLRFDFNPIV